MKRVGPERWNRRLGKAIDVFRKLTNFDTLYLGGGNAENITLQLGSDIKIVSNTLGMKGGIWLWKDTDLNDGIQK
jgi:polyphosphate glucokinase